MKLTKKDKTTLSHWGYSKEDLLQIEKALKVTTLELDGEEVSVEGAIKTLGRKKFLSGIGRSSFHWTALRENEKGEAIFFDSSKLFK